jgi:Carbamoyltransferase N-terminus
VLAALSNSIAGLYMTAGDFSFKRHGLSIFAQECHAGRRQRQVLRDGKFKRIWIQPAAGDAGGALGAALAAYHLRSNGGLFKDSVVFKEAEGVDGLDRTRRISRRLGLASSRTR